MCYCLFVCVNLYGFNVCCCLFIFLYVYVRIIRQKQLCNQPGILRFPDLLMDDVSSARLLCKVQLRYQHLLMHSLLRGLGYVRLLR